ncbi:hypothetical protein IC63_03255 [Paracoccus sphaerophysae]|uniref:GAF domain-containing protein n=1 Tax=Paracoccus sphaerophysae TaxID=690417 RepID=A0A099FFR4_9RHOB|nr:hypothetical protein IC63_03255 [Paracoccus sphaerophysae]
MAALDALVQRRVGARLFTVMAFDATTGISRRIWTNAPEVYPVDGEKPLPQNDWTRQVIVQRRAWVANTPAEVAEMLFDHATIAALGCGAALNLPVVVADQVIGTLNLLDAAGHFTPARLAAAHTLRLPGAAVLLRARLG